MKKLSLLAFIMMLCIACSVEEETIQNEGTNLEVELENYKGIFTTLDGQNRGTLEVTIAEDNRSATGSLTLATGEIIPIYTEQILDLGNTKEVSFTSSDLSFTMSTGEEGETMQIDGVTFRNSESSIIAGRNTNRAPLTTVTGTFVCSMCQPPLDNMSTQTFNLMFTNAGGNDNSITTQTTLAGTMYPGVATQSGCIVNGSQTTCDLNSGTMAGVMGTAFDPGGGPVTWSGTHTFDNGPSSGSDCSTVSGTWQWDASTIGLVGGAFTSDPMNDCPPPLTQLIFEDFEPTGGMDLPSSGYIVRDESNGVDRGENLNDVGSGTGGDYIGRVSSGSFGAGTFNLNNVQGTRVFSVCDIDGIGSGGWTTSSDNASIRWENINVSGMSTLTVSAYIGERLNSGSVNPYAFQTTTIVRIETSVNNITWTPIFQILGPGTPGFSQGQVDADANGTAEGPFIDNILTQYSASTPTGGASTMSVRIFFEDFDSGHEDLAIDNVTISGS